MTETEFVDDASALTAVFGEWPSFHDAEVLSMQLDRSGPCAPTLSARVHVFRMTDEVDPRGYYVRTHHTVVSLTFGEISLIQLRWFNTQNALDDLLLDPVLPDSNESGRRFRVRFGSAFGVETELYCNHIRVTAVEPFVPAT